MAHIEIGSRLGPYEILSALGAGGMGEVYRGRDTALNRDVALKVLHERFAADPERLARFQREAQVLASLNHPGIGSIYGLVDHPGGRALVLELVEGPTLADRIAAGPIPLDEALSIARQIAEALQAAHELGIVHRDLKPANVKLRPDGAVKVLDFGLAKALESGTPKVDSTQSPTITTPAMTEMGLILGTAAYMSPEQAKGRPADKRSDVWAFGCVLFEMLTGHRPFTAEDVADTLALILTRDPDWSLLPPGTPPSIRRLLRRCLTRDRSRRLADIADARLEIDERESEAVPSAALPAKLPAGRMRILRSWLPWVVAAAAVATSVWIANRTAGERPVAESRVVRSSIQLPQPLWAVNRPTATGALPPAPVDARPALGAILALSPDGQRLAIVMNEPSGGTRLWLRSLDGTEARPLAGTENGVSPFWSPDGRWLAFVADGRLKKLDPSGGTAALTLCDSVICGGAWSREGVILFTHLRNGLGSQGLARISAEGGPISMVTAPDSSSEWRHAFPAFLPDGRHFVFAAIGFGDQITSYIASLDAPKRKRLPMESAFLACARGCLLFAQGSTLMAQRLDERRGSLVGPAVPVAEKLRAPSSQSVLFATTSASGTLVYQANPTAGYDLVWYDRLGHATATMGTAADYADLRLSPDGRRALVSIAEPGSVNRDLWIFHVARGLRTRFTFDPASETHSTWSPDGSRIAFDSQRKGHRDLYLKAADGTGAEQPLLVDEFDKNPISWSPDGRFILYARRKGADVKAWVLPVGGDGPPSPLHETTTHFQLPGPFSPDGRWASYFSNESGRNEVYVLPFPGPGGITQVSTAGGTDPKWSPDGKEIFYRAPDGYLMVASVSMTPDRFDVGEVKRLFFMPRFGRRNTYDVSPDGQRILAVTQNQEAGTEPLTLVQNWPALLKK